VTGDAQAPHGADSGSPAALHLVRRGVRVREVVLAALPALLTVVLLLVATQPTYRTLLERGDGWSLYAYQGLAQDVGQYQVARLDPALSDAERRDIRDIALSSLNNPGQFEHLEEVERQGDARLAEVRALLLGDTPASVAAAVRRAIQLNAQAESLSNALGEEYLGAFASMRRTLLLTALATGVLSMLLILRALLLWRAERERRARREARQREALSLASHELRRPLQALLLASDLLRQADTPEQRQQLLGMIEDSALQLASRADLSRLSDLYLDVTLRVARTDLRLPVGRMAGGRVTAHVPGAPVAWPVDADRLRQIIENLVENAVKYTSGPVEVTLSLPGDQPEITVRDHGPGIPAGLRAQMFLPYERGPRGLTPGQGGSQGLGLSLARRYARAHGGDVALEDAPGGGTLARLTLGEPPLAEERRA
jgi:signal transduction histidine kinase